MLVRVYAGESVRCQGYMLIPSRTIHVVCGMHHVSLNHLMGEKAASLTAQAWCASPNRQLQPDENGLSTAERVVNAGPH